MPAYVQTMAYYGETPWHGLGVKINRNCSTEEMIKAAGLDWRVVKRPARGASSKDNIYSRYEIVRMPTKPEEREVILGLVSNKYTPLQNNEAFEFFEPLLQDKNIYFETAGALNDGERVWVLANLGSELEIVKGDVCKKYLLLSNSHNGSGSVTVKFTPIRVVCKNTLMFALKSKDGVMDYKVRHTSSVAFKLNELSEFLALVAKVFSDVEAVMKSFANVEMKEDKLYKYFNAVYPTKQYNEKNMAREKIPQVWQDLIKLMKTDGNLLLDGVKGTLWAAYNAITFYEDYKMPRNNRGFTAANRLNRVWFGSGAERKIRAFEMAKRFI